MPKFSLPMFIIGLFILSLPGAPVRAQQQSTAQSSSLSPGAETKPQASEKAPVLSFLEWKALRVQEAQKKLESLGKGPQTPGTLWQEGKSLAESEEGRPNEQKLNFNVDVALQLNVQDYFSMYLKPLTPDDFKEAVKKLTEDEKSELLLAYKNSTEKEKKIPLKFSRIPKDNAKSKNSEIQ